MDDINMLKILHESFSHSYKKSKNRIGVGSISGGARKLVLERIYDIQTETNPKMLLGTMVHMILEMPEPLSRLLHKINQQYGFDGLQKIITENRLEYEVSPGNFLKGLVDIETTDYLIEAKTTHAYMKSYVKEISTGNAIQLNTYLGIKGLDLGFLLVINMRGFTATFHSWDQIWEKHGFLLPFKFDQELFDNTILKAKTIFKHIEQKNANLPCPEESWECNYCAVRNQCGKIEVSCTHRDPKTHKLCSKKMHEWIECLTDNFKEEPICENCYTTKTSKRKDYKLIKYTKQYPWSDE